MDIRVFDPEWDRSERQPSLIWLRFLWGDPVATFGENALLGIKIVIRKISPVIYGEWEFDVDTMDGTLLFLA